MAELMTMTAYARSRDLSPSTITRQVRDGLIPVHGDKRLIDPEEADQIRAAYLHPGLKKGSLANPRARVEAVAESTDDSEEMSDEEWMAQWELRGEVGDMIPVKENERLLGLLVETEHERFQMFSEVIVDRVREVLAEEFRKIIDPIEELIRGATKDD